jgi:hypothetical protein
MCMNNERAEKNKQNKINTYVVMCKKIRPPAGKAVYMYIAFPPPPKKNPYFGANRVFHGKLEKWPGDVGPDRQPVQTEDRCRPVQTGPAPVPVHRSGPVYTGPGVRSAPVPVSGLHRIVPDPLDRRPYQKPVFSERPNRFSGQGTRYPVPGLDVRDLLLLNSVASTQQWIRQPKPRDVVHDVCVHVCECA